MTAATPYAAPSVPRWSAGRILLLVAGSLASLFAILLLGIGGTAIWANTTQRDDDGYFSTSTQTFTSSGYAISHTDGVDLSDAPGWVGKFATVRVRATGSEPIFIGIARTTRAHDYLRGIAHDEVDDVDYDPFSADYVHAAGGAPAAKPAASRMWAAHVTGAGEQTLTWKMRKGDWSLVVMNADASRGVHARMSFGANVHYVGWIAAGLIALGLAVLAAGATAIYFGGRAPRATV
jgi:hypothetical protein